MNWMMPIPSSTPTHHQQQPSGVLVWIPIEDLQPHIQLQHQLEMQQQLEREREEEQLKMHLINLHQQAQLQQQEHPPMIHSIPLLDNNDAVFIPESGVDATILPFLSGETYYEQQPSIVPISELLQFTPLIHPAMIHHDILAAAEEELQTKRPPFLQPPKKQTLFPPKSTLPKQSPRSLPKSRSSLPTRSTTPRTTRAPYTASTSTTSSTSTGIPVIAKEEMQQPPTVLNEIRKRSATPTVLHEKKSDVEQVEANPK